MFNQLNQQDLPLHVTVLGWLHIASATLFLVIAILVFTLLTGIGVASGEAEAVTILSIIGITFGLMLGIISIPGFAAGYGLLKHYAWGRILGIIIGILNLISFPIGTLVGLYTLWVLFQEAAGDYFAQLRVESR